MIPGIQNALDMVVSVNLPRSCQNAGLTHYGRAAPPGSRPLTPCDVLRARELRVLRRVLEELESSRVERDTVLLPAQVLDLDFMHLIGRVLDRLASDGVDLVERVLAVSWRGKVVKFRCGGFALHTVIATTCQGTADQ